MAKAVDKSHLISYIERMKGDNMKTVTINVTGASQGQWSTFLLELNLMKKAWRSYGVDAELKAKNIKKIIEKGTSINDPRPKSKRVQQDKRPKTLKVMAQKSKGVGKWI